MCKILKPMDQIEIKHKTQGKNVTFSNLETKWKLNSKFKGKSATS